MVRLVTNQLGLSDIEANNFFGDEARQPYKSKLEFAKDSGERAEQFLKIGNYLRMRYQSFKSEVEPNLKEITRAADMLRNFLDFSTYNLFQDEALDLIDVINGIDAKDRHSGTIKPTKELLDLFESSAKDVALSHNANWKEIYDEVLKATEGGNFQTAFSFLMNRKGDPAVRKVLQMVIERNVNDNDLQIKKLQLIWNIEAYRMRMGVDWETYLEIGDLPDSQTTKEKLLAFLNRPDLTEEVRQHLEREAPDSYRMIAEGGTVNYWDVLKERAEFYKFPDQAETSIELGKKKKRVWKKLKTILPLAFEEFATNFIDAPVRMGASLRASNTTYYNAADKLVNVVILDPRDKEDRFEEITGHELAHKLHAKMLTEAANAGYLISGSNENVPSSIKEEFSQLIEDQIGRINAADKSETAESGKNKNQGEFRDLTHAIVYRRQAPFALIQQEVRLKMEKIWRQENQAWELSGEHAKEILDEVGPMVSEWYGAGVPLTFPYHSVTTNLNILAADDGLVYVRKQLMDKEENSEKVELERESGSRTDMKTAFEQRFGPVWLLNLDAKKVLLGLMAETGRNYDLSTYGDYVMNADLESVTIQLREWGIDNIL